MTGSQDRGAPLLRGAVSPAADGRAGLVGRASRLVMALALSAALGGALAPAPAAAQDEPIVARVDRILVEGARRVDADTVKAYMTVQEGGPATPAQINESLRRLFETGLFEDVSISPLADGLLVQVVEAAYINRVVFEGNDAIDSEELLGIVQSAPRNAFSRAAADKDAQAILDLYRRTGRYGASVEPQVIRRENNRVDVVFEIQEGGRTGVRDISFVGNNRFSDRSLRSVINTRESGLLGWLFTSDTYDPDKLEFDKELLRRYYLENGHADFLVLSATAELTPDREDFVISFTVDEGERYTFGALSVDTPLTDLDLDVLQAQMQMQPGDEYDAGLVDKTIEKLVFEAGRAGYAFIDVRPEARKNVEEKTVDLLFRMAEGPRVYVERIDIEGNSRTQDRVLRRQFTIAEGDAYDVNAVQAARGRLRNLGFFSDVALSTERGSADDRAVVKVKVEEQLTGSISFGVGYSSSDGPIGDITISERNFLGRGQFVSARVNISGDEQALSFGFQEPALLDRDLAAGFAIDYTKIDRTDEASFQETNIGIRPYVEFPLSEKQRLRARYRLSSDEIRDVAFHASPAILADEGNLITSAVGATWTYDERNDPVEPTEGYLFTVNQDVAGLGGDALYSRTVAKAKGWTSFYDDEVVASLELEAGGIIGFGDDLRITDRFFLGGDRFRGFDSGGIGPRDVSTYSDGTTVIGRDDSLGGKYFAVMRTNVTFPLGLPEELGIYGGLFADAGTVWGLDSTSFTDPNTVGGTATIDDGIHLRASVGASLFIDSPFGPLRFNFAYPVVSEDYDSKEYFRFTAGTRF
ncbi:MAG: outer membrane protein insertion porin family [Paracoccaceae bacterium]|jgi:outer membrane protein insertion porin family